MVPDPVPVTDPGGPLVPDPVFDPVPVTGLWTIRSRSRGGASVINLVLGPISVRDLILHIFFAYHIDLAIYIFTMANFRIRERTHKLHLLAAQEC